MNSTVDLFGNVDDETWKLQIELSKKRIGFGKLKLDELLSKEILQQDTYAINKTVKAIRFWEKRLLEAEECK